MMMPVKERRYERIEHTVLLNTTTRMQSVSFQKHVYDQLSNKQHQVALPFDPNHTVTDCVAQSQNTGTCDTITQPLDRS
jgi:hypothetical protein